MSSSPNGRKVVFFHGRYSATLPPGIGMADWHKAGQGAYKEQFYFEDEHGREIGGSRIDVIRSIVSPSIDLHPKNARAVYLHPAAADLSDSEIMRLTETGGDYRDVGTNEMHKSSGLRKGRQWLGYHPAERLMYQFNIWIPSGHVCRRFSNEVVCVHRYLDDTFDWRRHVGVTNDTTAMSPEQIQSFAETNEMELATRIVRTIEPVDQGV